MIHRSSLSFLTAITALLLTACEGPPSGAAAPNPNLPAPVAKREWVSPLGSSRSALSSPNPGISAEDPTVVDKVALVDVDGAPVGTILGFHGSGLRTPIFVETYGDTKFVSARDVTTGELLPHPPLYRTGAGCTGEFYGTQPNGPNAELPFEFEGKVYMFAEPYGPGVLRKVAALSHPLGSFYRCSPPYLADDAGTALTWDLVEVGVAAKLRAPLRFRPQ